MIKINEKVLKQILFITDDFSQTDFEFKCSCCEHGIYFYNAENNWLKFKFEMADSFARFVSFDYDAILIDYGLLGDDANSIDKLFKAHEKHIPLAWVGGLGGWYNTDVKRMFPKLKFLHNLPETGVSSDDILYLLYGIFKNDSNKVT